MDVRYPGFGRIIVEGTEYEHDVVIAFGAVRKRDKGPSRDQRARYGHTPLTAAEQIPWSGGRLVIGTGYSSRLPITEDVVAEARARGVELVTVPTAEACTILRDLEPQAVCAVLHVTC
jgi:hypothetical protein